MSGPDRFGRTAPGTVGGTKWGDAGDVERARAASSVWIPTPNSSRQEGGEQLLRAALAGLEPYRHIDRDCFHIGGRRLVDLLPRPGAAGGGACVFRPGPGPRWKAAAAPPHAGRALAIAGDARERRSAVSGASARLRGQAL